MIFEILPFCCRDIELEKSRLTYLYGMNTRPFSFFFRLKREYTGFPIKGARYHFLLFMAPDIIFFYLSPLSSLSRSEMFSILKKKRIFWETLYFWALNFCRDTPDLNWHRDTMNAPKVVTLTDLPRILKIWFAKDTELIRCGASRRVDTLLTRDNSILFCSESSRGNST